MKYNKTTLKNGVRIITVPIPSLESATITIWVGVGSRFEEDRVLGVSHFLEHMVFKGSVKRPSAKEISEAVDEFGGEFNASTSKEWTNFHIKARTGKLDLALDVLADMVLNPLLKEEEIEREKGVILEEMAMYEDTPTAKIGDIFENLIFSGNELGRDIIGTKKSIKGVKRSDFVNHRSSNYSADNIVITIAGGFNEDKMIKLVSSYFSDIKKGKLPNITKFSHKQTKPKTLLHYKDIQQAHFEMGFVGEKRGHEDRFAEAVLSTILGGGMSSRLFLEVRERRGLAYSVRTSSDYAKDTGYLSTYVGADIKRIDDAISVVLDQYYGLANGKYPIEDKELLKAKEFIKGHVALSLEDTDSVNSFFGTKELLLGKIEIPQDIYDAIDKVTKEDVYKVAKRYFKAEKLNFALIGPFKDQKRFEKLLI